MKVSCASRFLFERESRKNSATECSTLLVSGTATDIQ